MEPDEILSDQSLGSLTSLKTRNGGPSSSKTTFSAWQLYRRSIQLLSKLSDALKDQKEEAIRDRAKDLGDEVFQLRLWAEGTSEEPVFERALEELNELQHVILELLLEIAVITCEMLALVSQIVVDENSVKQLLLLIREGRIRLDLGFKSRPGYSGQAAHTSPWVDSRMQALSSFWAQLGSQKQSISVQDSGDRGSTISMLESLTEMLRDLQSRISSLMEFLPTIKLSILMTCPEVPPSTSPNTINVRMPEASGGRTELKEKHTPNQLPVSSFERREIPNDIGIPEASADRTELKEKNTPIQLPVSSCETRELPVEIFVGIDIGLTCTGVAVCANQAAWRGTPVVIQQWPGLKTSRIPINANKVPTRVGYRAGEVGIHSWGFECPAPENIGLGMAVKDMFKFYLDNIFLREKFTKASEDAPKLENVKLWYKDFLTALFNHVTRFLQERLRVDIKSTSIEFIFGIPTSWKGNDLLVRLFRELIDIAGFGAAGNVILDLTEGEACAVFTAKRLRHKFQEGEDFIVCDAGGGTTDMCALRVKTIRNEIVELEALDAPQVIAVGSVNIDDMFETKAVEQLRSIRGLSQEQVELFAHQVTRGSFFQTLKTRFGEEDVRHLRVNKLMVPNSINQVILTRDELEAMFDSQVQKIIAFIEHQMNSLRSCRPDVTLPYIVLAGGLGSSKYVQDEIVRRFRGLRVLFAPDPEELPLAVCKGLVIDRLQQLSNELPVIPIRSSYASYGILCRELYNEQKHHSGQHPRKNKLDGRKYARNQIDWLVLKGQRPVRGGGITRMYSLVVDFKTTNRLRLSVVYSTLATDQLPTFLEGNDRASVICHVVSDSRTLFQEGTNSQRRSLTGKRTVFSRVDCELSAVIGVGKMEFNLKIIGDGGPTNQNLEVQWLDNSRIHDTGSDELIRNI